MKRFAYDLNWLPPNKLLLEINLGFWQRAVEALAIPLSETSLLKGIFAQNRQLKNFFPDIRGPFGFNGVLKQVSCQSIILQAELPRAKENPCPSCDGTGKDFLEENESCRLCEGKGTYLLPDRDYLNSLWQSLRALFFVFCFPEESKGPFEIEFLQPDGNFRVQLSVGACSYLQSCFAMPQGELHFLEAENAARTAYLHLTQRAVEPDFHIRRDRAGLWVEIRDFSEPAVLMPEYSTTWDRIHGLRLASSDVKQVDALAILAGLSVLWQEMKPAML